MILNFVTRQGLDRAYQKWMSYPSNCHCPQINWNNVPDIQKGKQACCNDYLHFGTIHNAKNKYRCYQHCNVPGNRGNSWTMTFANEEFESVSINAIQNSPAVPSCLLLHAIFSIPQPLTKFNVTLMLTIDILLGSLQSRSNCSTSRQKRQPQGSVVIEITGR